MSFFMLPLVASLALFFSVRFFFKAEPRVQVQIDAIMIGIVILMYTTAVGLLGRDWAMASLNVAGVIVAAVIYRSCIGWPSRETTADAFRRQKKAEPKFVAPEDRPEWPPKHHP